MAHKTCRWISTYQWSVSSHGINRPKYPSLAIPVGWWHSPLCKAVWDHQWIFQKRLRVVFFVIISLNTLQIHNTTCFVHPLHNKLPQFQIWLDLAQLLPIPVIDVPSPCTNIGMNLVIQSGCCIIHVQPGSSEFNFGMTHICTEMCVCKVGCAWKVTSLCVHI